MGKIRKIIMYYGILYSVFMIYGYPVVLWWSGLWESNMGESVAVEVFCVGLLVILVWDLKEEE